MINDLKEYVPWEALGVTELEYVRQLHLDARAIVGRYHKALAEIAKRTEITYGVERPTSEAKIALDVLSKFGD